nr:M20/M25/M40 family metallo-hydrolase [Spiroplasma phoeniceum]
MDVVLLGDLNKWEFEPFKPQIKDNKLFGRGAIDDKGPTIINLYALKYLKDPIIANQSYKHFDMNYLVLNFNYKELLNMDILKKSNSNYFVNDVKQNFYSLDNLFQVLDYFYSNVLRVIFNISNFREFIYFTSNNGNLSFVFFVKNGFLLYPKSMVFNILRFPDTDIYYLKPRVQLYNAYTINSTNDYFSYYSNWDYKTNILPSNNDKYTQSIKLLDMTDRSKYQGFNLIRFSTTTLIENRSISINGFNFSLYNATDWNGELNDGKIWQLPYKKGAWYRLDIHIENSAIWIVNNLPGMKEIYKFVNGIVHVFSNMSELFNNIGNLFAFDITFKIMLSSILVLAMVNGLLRYF